MDLKLTKEVEVGRENCKNEGENDEKREKMRRNTRKSGFLLKKLQKCLVGS